MPRQRVILIVIVSAVISIGLTALVFILLLLPMIGRQNIPYPSAGGGEQSREVVFDPNATTQVIVALQRLPRGFTIPENALNNAVGVREWPSAAVPVDAIVVGEGQDVAQIVNEQIVGRITRTDIEREQPLLYTLLTDDLTDLARVGSDAAAQLPQGMVAISLPIDKLSGVAYGVQPGDHVDLIFSFAVVDVDEQFQSALPNWVFEVEYGTFNEEGARVTTRVTPQTGAWLGRIETIPPGELANVVPSEPQRPRLVTQRGVLNALVLQVGEFPLIREEERQSTNSSEVLEEYSERVEVVVPPYATVPPDVITLAVTPQEAVVITWALNAQVDINLVIRSVRDVPNAPTSSVTLQYMFETYNVPLPPKLPYSLEPSLRQPPSTRPPDDTSSND